MEEIETPPTPEEITIIETPPAEPVVNPVEETLQVKQLEEIIKEEVKEDIEEKQETERSIDEVWNLALSMETKITEMETKIESLTEKPGNSQTTTNNEEIPEEIAETTGQPLLVDAVDLEKIETPKPTKKVRPHGWFW